MALHIIEFNCKSETRSAHLAAPVHYGVVGSGDLEVIMEPCDLGGEVKVRIATPVSGFEVLWRKVIEHFIAEAELADTSIEINDNNASPAVVSMRLRQAFAEDAA